MTLRSTAFFGVGGGDVVGRLRFLFAFRGVCVSAAIVACVAAGLAQEDELFFATNNAGHVIQLDSRTGEFVSKTTVPHHAPCVQGLTSSDAILITLDGVCDNPFRTHLIKLHPADASHTIIGSTDLDKFQFAVSIDADPSTGRFYAIANLVSSPTVFSLYNVDSMTGSFHLIAPVSGTTPNDWCTALAIDSTGRAIVSGYNNPRIYELNLNTGVATLLGPLGLGAGRFLDLAFSQSGVLWGVYNDHGSGNLDNGLYTIDLDHVRVVKQVHLTPLQMYSGIAFMPAPPLNTYCTAKTSSNGCIPSISAQGIPSATASIGFRVRAREVRNNSNALLMYGLQGPDALPFKGGTLCMRPPIQRTAARSAGGTLPPAEDCTGALAIDLNTFVSLSAGDPALRIPGTTVHCQWLVRDPGFPPPNDVALSDALQFVVGP